MNLDIKSAEINFSRSSIYPDLPPNGLRYLRVGGRGQNSENRILFGCR